jgi:hypothetical protein
MIETMAAVLTGQRVSDRTETRALMIRHRCASPIHRARLSEPKERHIFILNQ